MTHAPREQLLMAHIQRPGELIDAEPVIVVPSPDSVVLVLDDGSEVAMDRRELEAAIALPAGLKAVA